MAEATVVRMDIWAGENSSDHVARSHHPVAGTEWAAKAQIELALGNLVNLRGLGAGEGWGPNEDFDDRSEAAKAGRA